MDGPRIKTSMPESFRERSPVRAGRFTNLAE
jgi:hypothetical protein